MRTPSTPIPLWAACPPKAEAVSYLYKNLSLTSALNSPENVTPSAFKGVISEVAQSCLSLCDPMDCIYQASLSMGFSRQEYWSGLLFPSLGDLPDPGIKPTSPALHADALPSEPPGNHISCILENVPYMLEENVYPAAFK